MELNRHAKLFDAARKVAELHGEKLEILTIVAPFARSSEAKRAVRRQAHREWELGKRALGIHDGLQLLSASHLVEN